MKKNEYLEKLLAVADDGSEKLSTGTLKVLRAYYMAVKKDSFELDFEDGFFRQELDDALETMQNADIDSFRLFDSSSGLMGTVHFLLASGFNVEPVEKVDKWGDRKSGLRFIFVGNF